MRHQITNSQESNNPSSPNRRLWLTVAAIGAVLLLAAHALLSAFDFGDRQFVRNFERPAQDWIYEILMVAAAVAVLLRAVGRRTGRLGWLLFGTGLAFWAAGDCCGWSAYGVADQPRTRRSATASTSGCMCSGSPA